MLLKSYQLCWEGEQGKGTIPIWKVCQDLSWDLIWATTEMGIEFLREYFKTGVGYSSANSAHST